MRFAPYYEEVKTRWRLVLLDALISKSPQAWGSIAKGSARANLHEHAADTGWSIRRYLSGRGHPQPQTAYIIGDCLAQWGVPYASGAWALIASSRPDEFVGLLSEIETRQERMTPAALGVMLRFINAVRTIAVFNPLKTQSGALEVLGKIKDVDESIALARAYGSMGNRELPAAINRYREELFGRLERSSIYSEIVDNWSLLDRQRAAEVDCRLDEIVHEHFTVAWARWRLNRRPPKDPLLAQAYQAARDQSIDIYERERRMERHVRDWIFRKMGVFGPDTGGSVTTQYPKDVQGYEAFRESRLTR